LIGTPFSFAHRIGRLIGAEFAVTQNQSLIIPFWGKATLNFGLCWYEIFKAREDPMDVFCYDDPCFE